MFRPSICVFSRFPVRAVSAACVIFMLAGCVARSEVYDINIHNATTQPVTITLAKEAGGGHTPGPYEPTWASPEDVAIGSSTNEWLDRQVVPPGREAWLHHLSGHFNPDTRGMVRCYKGNLKLEDVLARGKGDPGRRDVPLTPGNNDFTVVEHDGQLDVEQNAPKPKQGASGS